MKSPFPGMDPYIEPCGYWGDFHNDLIAEIKRTLAAALPEKYRVRTGERDIIELVEEEGKRERAMYPDLGVTGPLAQPPAGEGGVAVAEPTTENAALSLRAFIAEEFREQFIEIHTTEPERRLVTCIEVLSPSNKRQGSTSREQYLRKRQALLLGAANLVEIDLLRGGTRMPMLDPLPKTPYYLLVGRWYKEAVCRVWPASYLRALPPIPIPLDRPDPDVTLDLQPLVNAIYERSRYGLDIDYTKPLDPPLADADRAWLVEQLKVRQAAH
ncbi:MAG TPA: DUF4058 family protein [Gemmataceae bacterium]|nr:DUF4058 family protein [Gemmataceae bacterium]